MNGQDEDKTRSYLVPAPGVTVSHYRIIERIGAGGMGEVYLAKDLNLGRKAALKFLASHFAGDDNARARFLNEARAAAALDHPNIFPIYEIDEANGHTFIAMAYIDGQSISERVSSRPLKIDEVQRIGIDIARGLKEAHAKGVVHRDIKSANVLVTREGLAKITDFGLAKLVDSTALTKAGTVMGTAAYMSPEQVRGESSDRRSDIWSLGVVLYEMITGQLPFKGEKHQSVTHQILHHAVEPVTAMRSGVPMDLERVVSKCLEKDPRNRYQYADDLLVDLSNLGKEQVSIKRRKSRVRFLLPASIAVLSAALLLVTGLLISSNRETDFANPLAGATFRKLTTIEGYKDATISPDGKFVAFVSDHDGEYDIWVAQVETGNVYNRTKGQFGDMRRGLQDIGFTHGSSELVSFSTSSRQPIVSLPLMEGPAKKILRDSVIMAFWSPNGNRVVYYTASPGDPVFVADANGTDSRLILSSQPGMHQHYQRWSPDGDWIYLNRGRDHVFDAELWRVRPDGSDLEKLTEDQLDVTYPTPINNRIVLYIAKDEDGEGPWIWAVDVETRASKRVSIGPEKYNSLSASQDGRRLVASVIKPESSLLEILSVPILDTIATESDVSQVLGPEYRTQAPRFGGSALYYLSSELAGDGLWKYENGHALEIWNGARAALAEVPAISPDGKSIAIALKDEGKEQLYMISSDGSNLRLLSDSIDVRGTCSFSPDGEWIVTGGYYGGEQGLFKISVNDGHHEKLVDDDALDPVWSPRGDPIVYAGKLVNGFSPLRAVHPDGEAVRQFPDMRVFARGERFRFLPDGSGLVYMRGWIYGLDFWLLDLPTMETRQLTRLAKGHTMRTFDISPDGSSIVFDRLHVKTEIVLIELTDEMSD